MTPRAPSSLRDPNIQRGADVLATRCLCVASGERVHLLTWRLDDLCDVVEAALARAGARVQRVRLDPLEGVEDFAAVRRALAPQLEQATASVLVAADGMPVHVGVPVLELVRASGSRHLHVTRADPRVFAQSMLADPDRLAMLNARVADLIAAPTTVQVTGEGGTDLELLLAPQYPTRPCHGRPKPGELDNLPAGFVFVHPSRVSGIFVADRGVLGTGVQLSGGALRRSPVRFELASGRVKRVTCADPAVTAQVEAYLARHPDAGRVGMALIPTNYLVRSEIGLGIQDALLPGLSPGLGTSHSAVTGAPYECPVQLRLYGRRLTVEANGQKLVDGGRLADWLVDGIDPFR